MKSDDIKKITGAQLRAARALLGWTADDVAKKSGVGVATIRRAELVDGPINMTKPNQEAVKRAFSDAGVLLVYEPGVGAVILHGDSALEDDQASDKPADTSPTAKPRKPTSDKASSADKGADKSPPSGPPKVGAGARAKREATKASVRGDTVSAPALEPHVVIAAPAEKAAKLAKARAEMTRSPAEMVAASKQAAREVHEALREEAPIEELRRVGLGEEFD